MYQENHGEQGYLDLLQHILDNGTDKEDRTGTGTRSIFGAQLRFDLGAGFPLLTTKKVFPKGVFGELAWLIRGETNAFGLLKDGIPIWNDWADPRTGDLGPIYGKQWRDWGGDSETSRKGIDQLSQALGLIRNDPNSRRIVVTAWNPKDNPRMALTPCHALFQFEVHDNKLSCHLYQRSADVFLGVPFNIASYAALTHLMAVMGSYEASENWRNEKAQKLEVGDLIMTFGDVHIYNNLFDQVKEQLTREPRPLPRLTIDPEVSFTGRFGFDDIKREHFILEGYDPHPAIKGEVSV